MSDDLSGQPPAQDSDAAASPAPQKYGFDRRQRLVHGEQFNRVFKSNQRSRDQYFIVLARRNHLTYARLGLAISRKAAGDAVPRNRLKRLVRESFRTTHTKNPGIDCVVMARPGAAQKSGAVLLESLSRHWAQVVQKCEA